MSEEQELPEITKFQWELLAAARVPLITDIFMGDENETVKSMRTHAGYRLWAPYLDKDFEVLRKYEYVEASSDNLYSREWRITREGYDAWEHHFNNQAEGQDTG